MRFDFIPLGPDCADRDYFDRLNQEAFPAAERTDIEEMFAFSRDADAQLLGIYEAGAPVGFAFLVKNAACGYVYYFAIDKALRSQGYGGAAIEELLGRYPQLQLILDFEELDPAAANYDQRLRRKGFYLRHGFVETGKYTMLRGNRFEVVCGGGPLREDAFRDLLQVLHAHCPQFPAVLYQS